MKMYKIILILVLTVAGLAGYDDTYPETLEKRINIYNKGNVVVQVKVEVADTPEERMRGLMFRKSLGQKEGMFFVFPQEGFKGFWMKNTYISLDIIFISEDLKVSSIVKDARPCRGDHCTTYKSEHPVKYALEVNSGLADQYGIIEGMRIEILP
ncbi:MAG: DUF192 domain-containing protein [Thermodesulfobacteriota bacterium]